MLCARKSVDVFRFDVLYCVVVQFFSFSFVSLGDEINLLKTAEPIKMPFGVWTRVGQRNCVRWGRGSPWEG